MILSSSLLARFARAARDATPSSEDGQLEVPNILLPVIHLPGPQRNIAGFVETENQRDSFMNAVQSALGASTAETVTRLCTFGRGLWHLVMSMMYLASFTQASGVGAIRAADFRIFDAGGVDTIVPIGMYAVNAVPQFQQIELELLFPVDTWSLRLRVGATGVGETHAAVASVVANFLH